MTKKRYANTARDNFVPARSVFANCVKVGCEIGYTVKNIEQAGFPCVCGAAMTWNHIGSRTNPTFMSRDKAIVF